MFVNISDLRSQFKDNAENRYYTDGFPRTHEEEQVAGGQVSFTYGSSYRHSNLTYGLIKASAPFCMYAA